MPKKRQTVKSSASKRAKKDVTTHKANKHNIGNLPDDCLVDIFSKGFSLQSQIGKLRLVCRRWKAVIESVCAQKRSIKLFSKHKVGDYADLLVKLNLFADKKFKLRQIGQKDDDLELARSWNEEFALDFFGFMSSIFPHLQHLILGFGFVRPDGNDQANLISILGLWPQLSHLSLFISLGGDNNEAYDLLLVKINSMTSLRALDLLGSYPNKQVVDRMSVEFLKQLEHLSISGSSNWDFAPFVRKLGSNLKTLRLNDVNINNSNVEIFSELDQSIQLHDLRFSVDGSDVVSEMCSRFPTLKRLDLKYCERSKYHFTLNTKLIANVKRLSGLEELSLENLHLKIKTLMPKPTKRRPSIKGKSQIKSLHLSRLYTDPDMTDGMDVITILAAQFPALQHLDYHFGPEKNCYNFSIKEGNQLYDRALVKSKFPLGLLSYRAYYVQCGNEHLARHKLSDDWCECRGQHEVDCEWRENSRAKYGPWSEEERDEDEQSDENEYGW